MSKPETGTYFGDSGLSVSMTNKLLSDEELQDVIYDIAECNVQDTDTGEMMYAMSPQKIIDLINTQKRLYAESVMENHRCPRPISRGNKSYGAGA